MRRGFITNNLKQEPTWRPVEKLEIPLYKSNGGFLNNIAENRPGFKRQVVNERNVAVGLHDTFRNERLGQKVHIVNEGSEIANLQSKDEATAIANSLSGEVKKMTNELKTASAQSLNKLSQIADNNNIDLSGLSPAEQKEFHNTFTARRRNGTGSSFKVGGPTWNQQIADNGLHSVIIYPTGKTKTSRPLTP